MRALDHPGGDLSYWKAQADRKNRLLSSLQQSLGINAKFVCIELRDTDSETHYSFDR